MNYISLPLQVLKSSEKECLEFMSPKSPSLFCATVITAIGAVQAWRCESLSLGRLPTNEADDVRVLHTCREEQAATVQGTHKVGCAPRHHNSFSL